MDLNPEDFDDNAASPIEFPSNKAPGRLAVSPGPISPPKLYRTAIQLPQVAPGFSLAAKLYRPPQRSSSECGGPETSDEGTGSRFEQAGVQCGITVLRTDGATAKLRIGSLDFELLSSGAGASVELTSGVVQLLWRRTEEPSGLDADIPTLSKCEFALPFKSFQPGTQDPIPGEEYVPDSGGIQRQAPPLVLPIGKVPELTDAYLWVQESAPEDRSQTLDLRLHGRYGSTLPKDRRFEMLVFDPGPVLIAKAGAALAELDGDETSNEIGNWSNRASDSGWELSIKDGRFDLVLPPQTIGEEMHRRRGEDIDGKSPIQFRFGTALHADLRASYHDQNFVEAFWNLRRILGYPGQRDPGARVESLEFELLYGILGRIQDNPALRLAELQTAMGRMAPVLDPCNSDSPNAVSKQTDVWRAFLARWAALSSILRQRPAVLEPRLPPPIDARSDSEPLPKTLTLAKNHGLSYSIRKRSKDGADLWDEEANNDGLKGSYPWAIEPKKIRQLLTPGLESSSGELTGAAFSSFGGSGKQVARFDSDLTAIISETEWGRISSLTIERVGRIGVFRNKAKHVVVYRRTVAPTPSSRWAAGSFPRLAAAPQGRRVRSIAGAFADLREQRRQRGEGRIRARPQLPRRTAAAHPGGQFVGREHQHWVGDSALASGGAAGGCVSATAGGFSAPGRERKKRAYAPAISSRTSCFSTRGSTISRAEIRATRMRGRLNAAWIFATSLCRTLPLTKGGKVSLSQVRRAARRSTTISRSPRSLAWRLLRGRFRAKGRQTRPPPMHRTPSSRRRAPSA